MRNEMKKQNQTLAKENARLEHRVAELEGLLGNKDEVMGEDSETKRASVTFSEVSNESKEEEAVQTLYH